MIQVAVFATWIDEFQKFTFGIRPLTRECFSVVAIIVYINDVVFLVNLHQKVCPCCAHSLKGCKLSCNKVKDVLVVVAFNNYLKVIVVCAHKVKGFNLWESVDSVCNSVKAVFPFRLN